MIGSITINPTSLSLTVCIAFTVGNTTYNVAPPGRLLLKSRTLSPSHESAHFDYFSFGDLTSANWRSRRNVDPENVHYKWFVSPIVTVTLSLYLCACTSSDELDSTSNYLLVIGINSLG